jgi:radical SAM superfamily enzyme YgiQ (UPF0313 family)
MRRLRICLINPAFKPSYWGMEHAMPVLSRSRRCYVVTGALPTLAALVPQPHDVVLLDENVEPIDFAALENFDVIGVTGMIVQRERMLEILHRLRGSRATVIVGGPYVSVAREEFAGLCRSRFIGEAETTFPAFLEALANGQPLAELYEQAERSDMAQVPVPRYDKLMRDAYMVATLQFSRGCPFLCEFCDIITIFGRRPRTKLPEQMLREVEAIRAAGFSTCFLVDDNFIGNKAKARAFLQELVAWQEANGFPIAFLTEASVNLSEDPEFIELMVRANFREVFVGIESPRPASLLETRKVQNMRGESLAQQIQTIRDGGLTVQAGFIVGFDNDDERIFDEQFRFVQETGIGKAAIAMLTPIPTTPLYDRLLAEGRLDPGNALLSFRPKQMDRQTLLDGYRNLLRRLYDPDRYFERLLQGYANSPRFRSRRAALDARLRRKRSPRALLAGQAGLWALVLRFLRVLLPSREGRALLRSYMRNWRRNRRLPEHIGFASFLRLCIEHRHFFLITRSNNVDYIGGLQLSPTAATVQGA